MTRTGYIILAALAVTLSPAGPGFAQTVEAPRPQPPPAGAPAAAPAASPADASADASAPAAPSRPPIPLVPEQPTWDSFHGQLNAQKYSPLDQITAENVGNLKKAWQVHTGDMSNGSGEVPETVWSATPIFANDTLYIGTPFYRILALDPATGAERWSFDSQSTLEALTQPALKNRGVAYWAADDPVAGAACQKIVYLGTMDAQLFAVDADTGKPCEGFANNGVLDVNQWNTINDKWPLSLLQPPTIVGDHLILGWAGNDWAFEQAPPGTVFSLNARTGALEWTFDVLPEEMRQRSGTANVWTQMSADEELGLVYLPVSSPSPNYWGGNRAEPAPLATSTTALDVETGKVVWSRQWVHHDIWDYDVNSAPTLMDITVDGKEIPALMQATKMGFLFVVNRKTGEDVWPIEERPVPVRRRDCGGRGLCADAAVPDEARAAPRPGGEAGDLGSGRRGRVRGVLAALGRSLVRGDVHAADHPGRGGAELSRQRGGRAVGRRRVRSGEPDRGDEHLAHRPVHQALQPRGL